MSDSVWPHRQQPTRLHRPWDSPGKNSGVGYHYLLQCMKVKSEREVAQLCLTLHNPMDCSLPDSSVHGTFQARVLEWGAIAFSVILYCLPPYAMLCLLRESCLPSLDVSLSHSKFVLLTWNTFLLYVFWKFLLYLLFSGNCPLLSFLPDRFKCTKVVRCTKRQNPCPHGDSILPRIGGKINKWMNE